jgi:hypothetical protein
MFCLAWVTRHGSGKSSDWALSWNASQVVSRNCQQATPRSGVLAIGTGSRKRWDMETEVVTAISAAIAAVAGALLGGLFPWLTQRNTEVRIRQAMRIERLEKEVRARIALEKAAVDWLVELRNKGEEGRELSENCAIARSRERGSVPKCRKAISNNEPVDSN